jgi:hypothetical protein
VLEYWLDHAEGFEVRARGRGYGHVERVLVDSGSGRAEALVVRSSLFGRTRVVPALSIVAVEPFTRVLVLRRERSILVRTGDASWRYTTIVAGAVGHAAVWLSPRAWRLTSTAVSRLASAADRAARWLALALTATLVWLRPRLSSLARAAASSAMAVARGVPPALRAALAWLLPRASTLLAQIVAGTRDGAAWLFTQTQTAVAWLRPRLKASFDNAVTSTFSKQPTLGLDEPVEPGESATPRREDRRVPPVSTPGGLSRSDRRGTSRVVRR